MMWIFIDNLPELSDTGEGEAGSAPGMPAES
jgi:hypothetical protein